jgi:pilus assembly protein CpaD
MSPALKSARLGNIVGKATVNMLCACAVVVVAAGCRHDEESMGHVAGWTLVDPSQRHPIIVAEKPATMAVRIARGANGLTPAQNAQVADFLARFRASDAGNSKLVVAVPSGGPNEMSAMAAVGGIRVLIREFGYDETSLRIEAYHAGRDPSAPIRISYTRYIAEPPACGNWPTNLGSDYRNVHYPNFGCATQRNFAVMVANPADLLGPRTMTPRVAERGDVVWDKYVKGESTIAKKDQDERASIKSGN